MPSTYLLPITAPLAYVEWFTPFGAKDSLTDMYTVTRSSRNHHVYAEIIYADRIVRNVHLVPKFGKWRDNSWTADNVAEQCNTFFVNPYIDTHWFCTLRANRGDCL